MSIHINRFIDRVRSLEHRGARDFTMTMTEARDLEADLAKLLLALHVANQSRQADAGTSSVQIDGGAF